MNSRERVFAALNRNEPDQVPIIEGLIDLTIINKIFPGSSYMDFVEKVGLDAVGINQPWDISTNIKWIDKQRRIYQDKWGVVRQFTTEAVSYPLEGPIHSEKDLKKYIPPNPTDEALLGDLPQIVNKFRGKKAVMWLSHDAFIIPSFLRGMDNFLMDFIVNPNFARKLINLCVEFNVEEVKTAVRAGAEIIILGDDYAFKQGPLMSPSQFREFILPGLTKVVQTGKREGAFVIKHTDGNIWSLMDMLVEGGIDAINPLEPDAGMDIGKVKRKYGNKLCLVGNIDCGYLLSHASVEKVIEAVRRCILEAAPGGGFIMSSSNSIHSSVKPENYMAMIKAAKKHGKYPIDF